MVTRYPSQRFSLGQLLMTPGALRALKRAAQTPGEFFLRHVQGDWGNVCDEDRQANEQAVPPGDAPERRARVLSVYRTQQGETLWVITEHDRSATTILLPEEY